MVTLGAIVTRIPVLIAAGMAPFAFLYAIGVRLSASMDDDGFYYRGWVRSFDLPWRDIVSVTSADNVPYPHNRYYGLRAYVIRTSDTRIVLNMLYFSPEFARAFHAATIGLRRASSP